MMAVSAAKNAGCSMRDGEVHARGRMNRAIYVTA
jgi:hypothetical protein